MDQPTQVVCPNCQAQVLETEINDHLDLCLSTEPNNKRQRTSNGSTTALPPVADKWLDQHDQNHDHAVKLEPAFSSVPEADVTAMNSGGAYSSSEQTESIDDKTMPASTKAPDDALDSLAATLQPEDHLIADLMGSQAHALRSCRNDSARAHAKIEQLCVEVQHGVERRLKDLEDYPAMAQPADCEQQHARNRKRAELTDVVRAVHGNLSYILEGMQEPDEALLLAEAVQLQKIDDVICKLQEFRLQIVADFQKCKEDEARQREASEATAQALEPSLSCLDCFVQSLAQEVDQETATAIELHTKNLKALEAEQLRFVKGNISPAHPLFAKVIEDIDATKRVLEEHGSKRASSDTLVKDWDDVLQKMPQRKQLVSAPVPTPERQTFLHRILSRS